MHLTTVVTISSKELYYSHTISMLVLVLLAVPLFAYTHTLSDLVLLTNPITALILVFFVLAGMVVHELLHALAFIAVRIPPKKIEFGIKPFYLYTHAHQWVSRNEYIFVLLVPVIALGVVPYLASLCTGNVYVFIWSLLMVRGAVGDFLMVAKCLNTSERILLVRDLPNDLGFEAQL